MQNRKSLLLLLVLFSINISLFAGFGFDVGLNYTPTTVDDSGTEIDSEYPFSLVALPSFSSGNFAMELNAPVFFKFDTSLLSFDYSNYSLPTASDDFIETSLLYTKYIFSFINYIQIGSFNDDLALRLGKITNSSLGDGAILYHYKDDNVGKFDTRAGLQVKLDGVAANLPLSVELITTDLFNPDLLGGRFAIRPIFFLNNNFLNKLTLGYSVTYNTFYNDPSTSWFNIAYDIQLPLFKTSNNSMIFYYDLISEEITDTSDNSQTKSLSQRFGLFGWYLTSFSYDAHIKNIIEDNAYHYDFGKLNYDLLSKTIIPQFKRDFIVSANTGYYSNNGLSEFTLGSDIQFSDLILDNYSLNLNIKSSKAIGPISNISAALEKNYIKDSTTGAFIEDFITGFTTLKNININLSANIIFYQINEITVGLTIEGDETGNIDPKYSLGYKFSLL